jgi:hypothetical protein
MTFRAEDGDSMFPRKESTRRQTQKNIIITQACENIFFLLFQVEKAILTNFS